MREAELRGREPGAGKRLILVSLVAWLNVITFFPYFPPTLNIFYAVIFFTQTFFSQKYLGFHVIYIFIIVYEFKSDNVHMSAQNSRDFFSIYLPTNHSIFYDKYKLSLYQQRNIYLTRPFIYG